LKEECKVIDQDCILVVDDDEAVLSALDAELREFYAVTSVSSAEQALAQLQAKEYSAIVSDVRMPGVDGLSLISQCAVRFPNMVRVILTAYDDDDVHETAIGPHGAYKLVKPWGDDLIITLQNALKQRRVNLALREHLDLKTEMLDIDRRLHAELDADTLIHEAAVEMTRCPEVVAAAIYRVNDNGASTLDKVVMPAADGVVPELKKTRSTPIPYQNEHLYSVPIGGADSPAAVIVLRLTDFGGDTLRYLDFVSRQAARTLLIINSRGIGDRVKPRARNAVSVSWLIKELTTPTTVLSSAPYSMTKILDAVKKPDCQGEALKSTVGEMEELFNDISQVASALTALLNQLRSQHSNVNRANPFPNES
jgi:CheY-like chemotaxis protein